MLEGSQPPPDLGPPPLPASLPEFRGIQVVKPTDILALRSFDCSQELRLLPSALEKEGERVRVCVEGGGVSVCVGCLRIFPLLSGKALNPMSALSWPEMKLRVWPALLLYEGNGTERWTLDLS